MTPELIIALFLVTCSAGLYWYSFKAFKYCTQEVDINSEYIVNINFLVDNNLKRIQRLQEDILNLEKELKENSFRKIPETTNQDLTNQDLTNRDLTKKRGPKKRIKKI